MQVLKVIPGPTEPCCSRCCEEEVGLFWSGLGWVGLVWFGCVGLVWSGLVSSGPVWFGLIWSGLGWFGCVGLIWSGLGWSGLFYLPGLLASLDQLLQLCNAVPPREHGLGQVAAPLLPLLQRLAQVGAVPQQERHQGAAHVPRRDPAGPPAMEHSAPRAPCPGIPTSQRLGRRKSGLRHSRTVTGAKQQP